MNKLALYCRIGFEKEVTAELLTEPLSMAYLVLLA